MQTCPKILVNRLGALGDVLLTTPIVSRIHKNYAGNCEIFVRTFSVEVYENNPFVARTFHPSEAIDISSFNVILNLDYAYENNPRMHILDAYELFVFGGVSSDRQPQLFPSPEDEYSVEKFLTDVGSGFIVLHMRNIGAEIRWQNSRNISASIWSSVIDSLLRETSLKIIQIGSRADLAFQGSDRLFDARELFSIQKLGLLIEMSRAFVGVDSAPYHIATTTSAPIVALFTTAKSDYRKPFRNAGSFFPIKANIECYGCIENLPLGSTSISCFREDFECRNRFCPDIVFETTLTATGL
jgi:ADP-heptose:LPS heptosyltransferase